MKLRAAKGKLKIEHRIIGGLRPVLEQLLQQDQGIRSIIPGVIRKVRDAKGPVRIRVTVRTTNGWKAIGFASGERQELFISTELTQPELEALIGAALAAR